MLAWDIAKKVAKTLNDDANIRCTVDELVMWFNSAQRAIVDMKPDVLTANGSIALVAGTKQSVAVVTVGGVNKTGLKMLKPIRNTGTFTRTIKAVAQNVLDTVLPGWHSATASAEVKSVVVDEKDPLTFYTYPPQPATGSGTIEALVAITPTDVTAAVDGLSFTSGQLLALPDLQENNMVDMMLYRALSKDSKNAINLQRAQNHYNAAATSLGLKVQSNKYYTPSSSFNQGGTAQ